MKAKIIKIDGKDIHYIEDGKTAVEMVELSEWVTEKFIGLGEANLTIADGKVTFCKMGNHPDVNSVSSRNLQNTIQNPKSDIVSISGKDFMTYEGLLKKAHEKNEDFSMVILESFVSEDMKMSWCKVRLSAAGRTFDGFGSSTPENTGAMTSSHPVEMAHTRAKGRALRDYLNIGLVMAEELK